MLFTGAIQILPVHPVFPVSISTVYFYSIFLKFSFSRRGWIIIFSSRLPCVVSTGGLL